MKKSADIPATCTILYSTFNYRDIYVHPLDMSKHLCYFH